MTSRRSLLPAARSRALGRILAVLGVAFAVVGVTMVPALAHHPLLSAKADCQGNVTWTSTAWASNNPLSRANADVRVERQIGNSWSEVGRGAYTDKNGYHFSGSFNAAPTAFPMQLRARAVAAWGDKAGGGQVTSTTVGAPSGCSTPPSTNPKASISHDCKAYTVVLDNKASQAGVTYSVTVNGSSSSTYVEKNTSKTITKPVNTGASYSISVSAGSPAKQLTSSSFKADSCTQPPTPAQPSATIDVSCAHPYDITLKNSGGTATTLTVTRPGEQSTDVPVGPGQTKHLTGTPATGTYQVKTSGGTVLASKPFDTATCSTPPTPAHPSATIDVNCTTYRFTLTNSGGTATTLRVIRPGQPPLDVPVGPGDTKQITGQSTLGVYTVTTSTGDVLTTRELTSQQCSSTQPPKSAPKASVAVSCAHGFQVTLDNSGSTVETRYTVTTKTSGETKVDHVDVAAGDTQPKSYAVTDKVPETLTVEAPNMSTMTESFNGTCSEVSAPPSQPSTGTPSHGGNGNGSGTASSPNSQVSAPSASATNSSSSALPKTGNEVSQIFLLAGLGLLSIGVVMMMLARMKPQRT